MALDSRQSNKNCNFDLLHFLAALQSSRQNFRNTKKKVKKRTMIISMNSRVVAALMVTVVAVSTAEKENFLNHKNKSSRGRRSLQPVTEPTCNALSSFGSLKLEVLGTYAAPGDVFDESAAEIVVYNPCSEHAYVVNGADGAVAVLDASDPTDPTLVTSVTVPDGYSPTSVTFIEDLDAFAVAAGDDDGISDGIVVFYDVDSFEEVARETVGNLPDNVAVTPDNKYVLTANEGEYNQDEAGTDPKGSVSFIYIGDGIDDIMTYTKEFSGISSDLEGVRIFPGRTPEFDFEPEYVAVSPDSSLAFVTLQENNAVLKIDLEAFDSDPDGFEFEDGDVTGLGFQDFSSVQLDPSNRDDQIGNFLKLDGLFGIRMPDSIAAFEVGGSVYYATANEGDGRGDFDDTDPGVVGDEIRIEDIVGESEFMLGSGFEDAIAEDETFGRLLVSLIDGNTTTSNTYDELYSFGSRSFSIFDEDGTLVFDSGSDFERVTFAAIPDDFNSNNDDNDSADSRSDDKGPEPEAITVGEIDGRTYAFIGLERVGGIMVYDVTEPASSVLITYFNNRDFEEDAESPEALDLGPEGIAFVDKDDSPTGNYMLIVANEVSGTTTFYDIVTMTTKDSAESTKGKAAKGCKRRLK